MNENLRIAHGVLRFDRPVLRHLRHAGAVDNQDVSTSAPGRDGCGRCLKYPDGMTDCRQTHQQAEKRNGLIGRLEARRVA